MATFEMPMKQLLSYQGSTPCPSDFDSYWCETLYEVAAAGTDYHLTLADVTFPSVECYHLTFIGIGGAKIHGKFIKPAQIVGTIPAVVLFHGYCCHCGDWFECLPYAYSGKAVLALDVRGQGGLSEDTLTKLVETVYGHTLRGALDEDPKKLFYRYVYSDCVQAVRIAKSMSFINKKRIGISGGSQGGGLSIACAGLESVAMVAPIYPFLSDFKRMYEMDLANESNANRQFWQYFRQRDPYHRDANRLWERLGYIDVQNLAKNITAEVLWFMGMMDKTCPPSTQFATYNKITAPKELKLLPDYGHEALPCANDLILQFFSRL